MHSYLFYYVLYSHRSLQCRCREFPLRPDVTEGRICSCAAPQLPLPKGENFGVDNPIRWKSDVLIDWICQGARDVQTMCEISITPWASSFLCAQESLTPSAASCRLVYVCPLALHQLKTLGGFRLVYGKEGGRGRRAPCCLSFFKPARISIPLGQSHNGNRKQRTERGGGVFFLEAKPALFESEHFEQCKLRQYRRW